MSTTTNNQPGRITDNIQPEVLEAIDAERLRRRENDRKVNQQVAAERIFAIIDPNNAVTHLFGTEGGAEADAMLVSINTDKPAGKRSFRVLVHPSWQLKRGETWSSRMQMPKSHNSAK